LHFQYFLPHFLACSFLLKYQVFLRTSCGHKNTIIFGFIVSVCTEFRMATPCHLTCPITLNVMTDPVMDLNGHSQGRIEDLKYDCIGAHDFAMATF